MTKVISPLSYDLILESIMLHIKHKQKGYRGWENDASVLFKNEYNLDSLYMRDNPYYWTSISELDNEKVIRCDFSFLPEDETHGERSFGTDDMGNYLFTDERTEHGTYPLKNISQYSTMFFDIYDKDLMFFRQIALDDSQILEQARELIGFPGFLLKEMFSPFEYTIYKAAIESLEK
jgi:hypothetical protein